MSNLKSLYAIRYPACTYLPHCSSLSRFITIYSAQSVGYIASKCNGQRCFYLPLPNASYLLMVLQRCMDVDTQDVLELVFTGVMEFATYK